MNANGQHLPQPGVPRMRFVVVAALWITAIFLYFDRVNISMAAPHIMKELGLSGVEMGLILSMFSWGFIFGHVSGGVAADRLNIRRWCSALFLLWCIATVATGMCRSVLQFVVARTLFGFAEGAVANPMNKLQNHWVFPYERGLVNGTLMCSAYLGLVAGVPLVGWLIADYGWRMMFWMSGIVSLAGVGLFWVIVRDYPSEHPWIPLREKQALESALARDRVTFDANQGAPMKLPFAAAIRMLFGNWVYWAICGAFFFQYAIYVTNFSWLPGYLVLERGFSEINSGAALVLPYLAAAIGALSGGFLSDRLGSRCGVIIAAAALTMPAIAGLLLLNDPRAVIFMLCLMLFFNAAAVSIFVVLLFDLFPPEIIGVALALAAGVAGGLGGAAGPMVMGLSYDLSGSFAGGFTAMGAGMIVSIVLLARVYAYERGVREAKDRNRESLIAAAA
jgi:sugar phosphate permease